MKITDSRKDTAKKKVQVAIYVDIELTKEEFKELPEDCSILIEKCKKGEFSFDGGGYIPEVGIEEDDKYWDHTEIEGWEF